MKVKTVSYSKVFSLGNYENEKLGVEFDIADGDDVQKAMQKAREFVEFNHKLNGIVNEQSQCEHVVANPDDFTGAQVKRAKDRLDQINEMLLKGQQLLLV
jgi:hypothetical protein